MKKDHRIHILIVDDDEDDYIITRDLLAESVEMSFTADWISTYDEARQIIMRREYDVYLLDYRLGKDSGLELLKEVISKGCMEPIILLTGQGDNDVDIEAMKSGASDYLVKGEIRTPLLERSIRYAIERKKTENALLQSKKELSIWNRIAGIFLAAPENEMYQEIIRLILEVTESKYGVFGYMDDGTLLFSEMFMDDRGKLRILGDKAAQPQSLRNGIWGSVLKAKSACFSNEPAGKSVNGMAIFRTLEVPIVHQQEVIGVLFVANKAGDYTEKNASLLETIANHIAPILYARLQRDNQERERLKAENEKEAIMAQFLQSRKMEAIGMLAGGVAHDFNNMLTTIQGNVELAKLKINKDNPVRNNLDRIYRTVERAANLTNQLLLFSRKKLMKPVILNMNEILDSMMDMLVHFIGEDIMLKITKETDLWKTCADRTSVEQMIMNLVVNARDAMPKGGELIIRTENVTLDHEYCKHIPYARTGIFIRLSVEDTGVGIDKESLYHLFDPFFSTKEFGKGTGLGLSVVYGVIKQHKGWINVYSEPEQGTVFKVYFPATFEKDIEKTEIKQEISLEELQGNGQQILVVEDEDEVREFAVITLRENGYSVLEAASSGEALKIFKKKRGGFQLIFCDVVLPDYNGLELVDQILSLKPDIHVLMTSGYMGEKSQWSVIREKNFYFLQKPYYLADLLQTVKNLLETADKPTKKTRPKK